MGRNSDERTINIGRRLRQVSLFIPKTVCHLNFSCRDLHKICCDRHLSVPHIQDKPELMRMTGSLKKREWEGQVLTAGEAL